jgi:hypothetical protein
VPAQIDRDQWSGEGDFTQTLLDWLVGQATVSFLKVEDSTGTRADVEYNFISNEIFLEFLTTERVEVHRVWGVIPRRRTVRDKLMTIEQLEGVLAGDGEIGTPDYADEGMIQFLRTERIVPPYQTRGYKLVELVRIYEVGTPPRR